MKSKVSAIAAIVTSDGISFRLGGEFGENVKVKEILYDGTVSSTTYKVIPDGNTGYLVLHNVVKAYYYFLEED